MNGVLSGGWGYVWAAYLITTLLLGGYAWISLRAVRSRGAAEGMNGEG